jgi:hypothetical protein
MTPPGTEPPKSDFWSTDLRNVTPVLVILGMLFAIYGAVQLFDRRMASGLSITKSSGQILLALPDGNSVVGPQYPMDSAGASRPKPDLRFIEINEYAKIIHTRVQHPAPSNRIEDQYFWPNGAFAAFEVHPSFLTPDQFIKRWH